MRKYEEKKIEAAEMWLYRRLLRVKWTEKRTNESILAQLKTKHQLLDTINKRKLKYFGHAARNTKTDLMKTVAQGKVEAKRKRGRPPNTLMDNITSISNKRLQTISQMSQHREKWGTFVYSRISATPEPRGADRWGDQALITFVCKRARP